MKDNMRLVINIFLVVFCLILQGCPIPAFYRTIKNGEFYDCLYKSEDMKVTIKAAHPYYSKQQKFVYIRLEIVSYKSENVFFCLDSLRLSSYKDNYYFDNGLFMKNERNRIDTIYPSICKEIDIAFKSDDQFSRPKFWKTIESDTLILNFNNRENYIELVGKDNRKINRN
jgi:hypothetical protein